MSYATREDVERKLKSGWEPEYFNVPEPVDEKELIQTPYQEKLNPNIKIVVTGGGGFIGGAIIRYLKDKGFRNIVTADIKPLYEWYQTTEGVENLCLDLRDYKNCMNLVQGAVEVYNFAADMGGMGFIETHRVDCLINSSKINDNMLDASRRAGATRYFFSSSACAYNTSLQQKHDVLGLKESDAYPADAERGYGWEKLIAEQKCQEMFIEKGLETHIARFHNVYGPYGTWDGGREKAPAALARKIIAVVEGDRDHISIWGDGKQRRSFMYIDDCVEGVFRLMHHRNATATPLNIGSEEMISVNELVDIIEDIFDIKVKRQYDTSKPQGVVGRNSDNTMIKKYLGWEPSTPFAEGMKPTCEWIRKQYKDRKAGKRTVS
ncbi:MAG: NAD-dependent epimerase/dehydratase family protein [Acidobacteriota bacterium]